MNSQYRNLVLASLFAALTAAGAFIKIPIPYVPFTLQTFFVLLAGGLLGARYGALSQGIYLLIGLLGAPVFANGGGPGYIFQPSFGYLLSYPLAAFLVGKMIGGTTETTFLKAILAYSISMLVIFSLGVLVLYFNVNYVIGKPFSVSEAFWIGFVVFIPGSLLKMLIAASLTLRVRQAFISPAIASKSS